MNLNYAPLSERITDEMIEDYSTRNKSVANTKTILSVAIVIFVFVGAPFIASTISSGGDFGSIIGVFGVLFVVLLAGTFAALYGSKLAAREAVRLQRFAEVNNAVYRDNIIAPQMSGMIFNEGHARMLKRSLSFNNGIEIGNSSFDRGSGKNQRTYNYSFARVALSRNLPHMVLDAKSNNFLGSNLPSSFQGSQRLQLEGDFNSHFDVYVPVGYERDALYVFTPDVMQALVDQGSKFDMEITGNELYVFKTGTIDIAKQAELSPMISIVESISSELRDQAKRYTDERAAQLGGHADGTDTTLPLIAPEGKKLKKRYPIGFTLFFVALVLTIIVPPLLSPDVSDIVVLIMWPIIVLSVIIFAVVNMMRSR